MLPSANQKLLAEKMPLKWNTFISLSPLIINAQEKYSENCRNIEMLLVFEQELALGMCTCLWHVLGNHQNKLCCLHFYTLQLVYNSQLFVFYSAQSPVTIEG